MFNKIVEKFNKKYKVKLQNCSHNVKDTINPYHKEGDVYTHTMMVLDEAMKNTNDKDMWLAALLHDIGKLYTRVEEDGKVKFYGHQNVSTQLALDFIAENINLISKTNINPEKVLYIINYHDVPYRYGNKKLQKLFRFDVDLYNDLIEFAKYDRAGSITDTKMPDFYEVISEELPNEKNKEHAILLLAGLPCAGKSTFITNFFNDWELISFDNALQKYAKEKYGIENYNNAFAKLQETGELVIVEKQEYERFLKLTKQGKNIVVDYTNLSIKTRKKWLQHNKYVKRIHWIYQTTNEILKRNKERKGKVIPEKVIYKMMKRIRLPLKGELFV